jgi:hypothetical protein
MRQRRKHFYPRRHFAQPIRLCLQGPVDRLRIEARIDGGMGQALVVQHALNGREIFSLHGQVARDLSPINQTGSAVKISTGERRGYGTIAIYGG